MICAYELELADRLELVQSVVAMAEPNEDLMRHNPLSKIPTLVLDDGSALFDSIAICEYLNHSANGSLFPGNGPEKWAALRWHALADGLLDVLVLWRNERDRSDSQRSDELIHAFAHKARGSLRLLDREVLAFSASPFSIAHITIGCALGYLDFRFPAFDWKTLAPALARWHTLMEARPSFSVTAPKLGG